MKARFIPVLLGLAAAALYLFNAWREYTGGDTGAAVNWAIGGVCLAAGYTLMTCAAGRRSCKRP